MAKTKSQYQCTECGAVFAKWQGQCSECTAWNTLVESAVSNSPAKSNRFSPLAAQSSQVVKLSDIQAQEHPRFGSGVSEFDRVLGGGMVPGMVVLLGGDPGIGKSTLLLQSMVTLAQTHRTLYVSGEESAGQIALRAQRLGLEHADLNVLTEIQLEQILA
ncbi:MAG TPA: ATPase domain-containing protein, partial [Limnobacter sp.]|nr:ATPase domain-containing protein [Limnobacter sp.]